MARWTSARTSAPVADQVLADEVFIALRGIDEQVDPARSDGDIADAGHPAAEAGGKGGEFRPGRFSVLEAMCISVKVLSPLRRRGAD